MAGWSAFLFAYFLGGITFLPLLLISVLAHAYLTFPYRDDVEPKPDDAATDIVQPGDDLAALKAAAQQLAKDESAKHNAGQQSPDVAAGYFAVCREYTPMGINAKPIERSTPMGSTTVAAPSQSVYQTMYRTIFDRKQTPGPLDNGKNISQRPKKAGNVFYVVLRHGHLMLFDDDEQVEVRHVISLAHHDVSIYSGGDKTPEGELFIKRNAICLSRTTDGVEVTPDSHISKPFYLFSENCSAKEDFYFALLRNQEQDFHAENKAPRPLQFDVKNIISLVQKLHSNEEQMQTRWLNAMIGRVFLGIYQTKDIENLIRAKLTKKIARVKRPSFLSGITIQKINTGDSAPYITNPRLKDLNVEGECTAEADVRYTGNFRIEVAATARIDLGSRFKAREVNLVLAVVLKKLEGHVLFKIKPPPSNRVWFSFQQMPKMEMALEPIISSRQITYTVILRQIENRIKEVVAETLVLPFWDDIPFFRTEHKKWRGGIWEGDDAVDPIVGDIETVAAQEGDIDEVGRFEENPPLSPTAADLPHVEKSHSLPVLQDVPPTGLFGRKLNGKSSNLASKASSSSTSVDVKTPEPARTRVARSTSFVQPPTPTTETNATHADIFKPSSSPPSESAAADAMAMLSARSNMQTPAQTSTTDSTTHRPSASSQASAQSSASSREATDTEKDKDKEQTPKRRDTVSSKGSTSATPDSEASRSGSPGLSLALRGSHTGSLARNFFVRKDQSQSSIATAGSASTAGSGTTGPEQPKRNALAAMSNAAATAKRWGISALQRHGDGGSSKDGATSSGNNNNNNNAGSTSGFDLSKPMGGGRPLPPPGTPLPGPDKKKSKTMPISITRKKAAPPPPPLPERPSEIDEGHSGDRRSSRASDKAPPPLPQRQQAPPQQQQQQQQQSDLLRRPVPPPPLPKRRMMAESPPQSDGENMLVVEAPTDSEPTTPDGSSYEPPWAGEMSDDDNEAHAEAGHEDGDDDDAVEDAKDSSSPDDGTPEEASGEQPLATPTALPNEGTIIAPPLQATMSETADKRGGHHGGEERIAGAAPGDDADEEEDDDDDVSAWMDQAEDDHEVAHHQEEPVEAN